MNAPPHEGVREAVARIIDESAFTVDLDGDYAKAFGRDHFIMRQARALSKASAILALLAPQTAATEAEPCGDWRPIATAPLNGEMVDLLIDYESPAHADDLDRIEDETHGVTIGFNNLGNTGEDRWQFVGWCWSHDHFTDRTGGAPLAWRPRPSGPKAFAAFASGSPPPAKPDLSCGGLLDEVRATLSYVDPLGIDGNFNRLRAALKQAEAAP